jgi:hypothetical protein
VPAKPKKKLSSKQKADAKKSAKKHGRSKPGLWENVNASKGKGPKSKSKSKGKTRPGKRSRKGGKKRKSKK